MTEDEIKAIKAQIDESASYRLWRLENNPNLVKGNFDANHLKAVHSYILQDSTQYIKAGEFREVVPAGYYHSKQRNMYPLGMEVFYANKPDEQTINSLLNSFKERLSKLNSVDEFSKAMAVLYSKLDYQHPFEEGNSRTLRYFSSLISQNFGFELDWSKTGGSSLSRVELYIARDVAIIENNFDFSEENLLYLQEFDNTEYGKHQELIQYQTREFFNQSKHDYSFRSLDQVIRDNTSKIDIAKTNERWAEILRETSLNHQNLESIFYYAKQIEKAYVSHSALQHHKLNEFYEKIYHKSTQISSGEIILPVVPVQKSIDR